MPLVVTGSLIVLILISLVFIVPAKLKMWLGANQRWAERLTNFNRAFETLLKNPRSFLLIGFYSLLAWLVVLICFKIFFYAYGADISFLYLVSAQPIIIFLGLLPVTVSGIGIRESAMLYFYHDIVSNSAILVAGLSYSFLAAVFLPILCLPFSMSQFHKIKF